MNYRVFLTRHYIDVIFLDINLPDAQDNTEKNAKAAEKLAERVARKLVPNSRKRATDNDWRAGSNETAPIQEINFKNGGMVEVFKEGDNTVYLSSFEKEKIDADPSVKLDK